MSLKSVVAICLLSLLCDAARADIRYTFDQHIGFTSWDRGFGLSGTITTDGSTGNLKSLDFIKDWSMTVKTPSSVDSTASQTLTPLNSLISLTLGDSAGLIVTTESITLAVPSILSAQGKLLWSTPLDDIDLHFETFRGGGLYILDASEPNGYIGVVAHKLGSVAIASGGVTVPEPSGTVYLLGLLMTVAAARGNGYRLHEQSTVGESIR